MPDQPGSTADYSLPKGYLSNAHHHYLFHPGYPEVYKDPLSDRELEPRSDSMERTEIKTRLGTSFHPDRPPVGRTFSSTSNSNSGSTPNPIPVNHKHRPPPPADRVKPEPGLPSYHSGLSLAPFRTPDEADHSPLSHPGIRIQPKDAAGPGPRTTEIREKVRMRDRTGRMRISGSDGTGRGGDVEVDMRDDGMERRDEMDLEMEYTQDPANSHRDGNVNVGNVNGACKTSTGNLDGLDVKDILQTYRTLRDRLPDVFPRRGVGTAQTLHVIEPNDRIDMISDSQNDEKRIGTAPSGDKEKEKEKEKEELRKILRLAMDGFKLVESVFANKSVDRSDRRPATEPSGARRDRGAGYGSFARERAERGRPTTGPAGRSYEWSEAEMPMSSPAGTDAAETSRGLGLAPSMGISFSSASTTPVSYADLTPNFAAQELPNRATSGASSHAKSTRMDIESSPLEETFVERPGSCSVNPGGAVAGNPVCLGCGATETPEWRRGPMGPRTLCNACGLVFAKLVRKRAREAAKAQAIAKGLLPPKKSRSKKAKLALVVESPEA